MMNKKLLNRKCVECGTKFKTLDIRVKWCCPDCGTQYAMKVRQRQREKQVRDRIKKEKQRLQERKMRLRDDDRSYWLKKAQDEVNRYIRLRDKGNDCIACGAPYKPNFQASHYVPRGRSAFLRFHEDNIHSGCVKCNLHESGNTRMFRIGLIKKIGVERVEWLEDNARQIKKWDIDELKELIKVYKAKIKEVNNDK